MILWLQWHTVLLDVVWTESQPKAITLGFKVMLSAKRCVYMVGTGPWKQTVCRIILFSEPTLEYPVTLFPKYVPEVILCTTEETIDHPMAHETKGW